MTRSLITLALMATLAPAADRPAIPADLTLTEALNIALSNSTSLREAQAQLDQASGRYTQARSPGLPQLSFGARQSYQTINLIGVGIPVPGVTGKIGPFGSMDARLYLSQELINFAHRKNWESSRVQVDSSRLLVDNARELITLNVVAAYLEALRAKSTRATLTEQTALATELYRLTRERVTQGASAELDANRAMQQVNSLEQQRQESEQTYVAAKLNLANIMQAQVTYQFEVSDPAAYGMGMAPDPTSAIKLAMDSRADYRSAQANVKAVELKMSSIKATRYPTVKVTVDDGQMGNTPVHNINTYKVQGTVEMPIFTGKRIEGEIAEMEGSLRDAQAAMDQSRSQIETEVLAAISGVEWGLKELQTSAGNVSLARQEVELARQRFTQGVADNTEVVNAQDRLSRADDANIRAQYMVGVARANLSRATGAAEMTYRK